jgi:hypothetical protein
VVIQVKSPTLIWHGTPQDLQGIASFAGVLTVTVDAALLNDGQQVSPS